MARRRRTLGVWVALLVIAALALVWASLPSAEAPAATALPERSTGSRAVARASPGPAGEPWRDVRCALPVGQEGDEVVVGVAHRRDATQVALIEDGAIDLVLPDGPLTLLADVPGAETVALAVGEDGACAVTNAPRAMMDVTVMVRFPSGKVAADASIVGCGLGEGPSRPAKYWLPSEPPLRVPAQPCELTAVSYDGMRQASDTVRVDPEHPHAELWFPYEEPAGLAVALVWSEGAVIVEVTPGSAAAELLEPGDRVMTIDGVPTEGLSYLEWLRLDAGPPDTDVTLVIEDTDGERHTVVVPRER